MSESGFVQHYVATHAEARDLIARHADFWVANCGCREDHGGCKRSRIDVCLRFRSDTAGGDSGKRRITDHEVADLLAEADAKGLVARPFRDPHHPAEVEGICFCCDCCCWYFQAHREQCDKGASIEETDFAACSDCGLCGEACYFGARSMVGGRLVVARDQCFGCGLCVEVCPTGAVKMSARD